MKLPFLINTSLIIASLSSLLMSSASYAKTDSVVLGMGCFWGAEKYMAKIPGVTDVESGYAGGDYSSATYKGVLAHEMKLKFGVTKVRNHAEVIKVTFDDEKVDLKTVLSTFWETHDPTQGDRQGNDRGTTYRSAVFYHNEAQKKLALETKGVYQGALTKANFSKITTEIAPLKNYATAEEYHQDYLVKNPNGYCALRGTSVAYPGSMRIFKAAAKPLSTKSLNFNRQIVVFESEDCQYCNIFKKDILNQWNRKTAITTSMSTKAPDGWKLKQTLFATPTIVIFENGKEVSRYTGYNGDKKRFLAWLGS